MTTAAVAERAPAPQLELEFDTDGGGITRIARRRVRYPYTLLKPFWFGDRPHGIATVPLQSASGGLFAGERLAQRIALGAGAAVHLSTQAASVVHARRDHAPAMQDIVLSVAARSHLEFLPEPLILFPGAALVQRIAVTLEPGACVLLADGVVQHDPTGGAQSFERFSNAIEVRAPDGRLLCVERCEISGQGFTAALHGAHGAWHASGLLLALCPASWHAALHAALPDTLPAAYVATAALPNAAGLVHRVAARDGAALRAALEAAWRAVRNALTGVPAPRRRK